MNHEPMKLLVDSHHGVYTYKVLAESYPLFHDNGKPFTKSQVGTLLDVDDEYYWDDVEMLEPYVRDNDGKLWRVESIEGDLFAIHPDAEWSDYLAAYYVADDCDVELELPESAEYWREYGEGDDSEELERYFEGFEPWKRAFLDGFYQVIDRNEFSASCDVPGILAGSTITVLVDVKNWSQS